jgi:2',3'-cyclic-nucleotide 2'-phosphodiesterase (5'-nucleotidase family)
MLAIKKYLERNKKLLWSFILIVILFSYKCGNSATPGNGDQTTRIIILYTNDEHGWMEATDTNGGAAGMMGLWENNEGYRADGPFLILSGGDLWTGPAISTWTKGEAMVDVMNAMGCDAAAIGNHEFDFKIEALNRRVEQANFPFLSANIRKKTNGEIPGFATPYIVKEVDGVRVGLIGLTTTSAPFTTFPDNVKDYDFISYDTALEEIVPQVKTDGAQLLIVVGHICRSEMVELAGLAARLGIAVIGGGHCHEQVNEIIDGVLIIEAGSYLRNYIKVDISFDPVTETVVSMSGSMIENTGGVPDQGIAAIVSNWRDQVNETLAEVIGYAAQEIGFRSHAMYNMVCDSWLYNYTSADVSLTNTGGIRQSIAAGDITLGTIVSVLPFENEIIELELTGAELVECIDDLIMGGMTATGGYQLSDGTPIESGKIYRVLTIDYLYSRTDYCFQYNDLYPYNTSFHYRQPVIDWIKSLHTSAANPLDNYLDHTVRR